MRNKAFNGNDNIKKPTKKKLDTECDSTTVII